MAVAAAFQGWCIAGKQGKGRVTRWSDQIVLPSPDMRAHHRGMAEHQKALLVLYPQDRPLSQNVFYL